MISATKIRNHILGNHFQAWVDGFGEKKLSRTRADFQTFQQQTQDHESFMQFLFGQGQTYEKYVMEHIKARLDRFDIPWADFSNFSFNDFKISRSPLWTFPVIFQYLLRDNERGISGKPDILILNTHIHYLCMGCEPSEDDTPYYIPIEIKWTKPYGETWDAYRAQLFMYRKLLEKYNPEGFSKTAYIIDRESFGPSSLHDETIRCIVFDEQDERRVENAIDFFKNLPSYADVMNRQFLEKMPKTNRLSPLGRYILDSYDIQVAPRIRVPKNTHICVMKPYTSFDWMKPVYSIYTNSTSLCGYGMHVYTSNNFQDVFRTIRVHEDNIEHLFEESIQALPEKCFILFENESDMEFFRDFVKFRPLCKRGHTFANFGSEDYYFLNRAIKLAISVEDMENKIEELLIYAFNAEQ